MEARERVRLARLALHLSQADLAKRVGMSRWVFGSFERGDGKLSYGETKAIGMFLAEQLGRTIRDFFPGFIAMDGHNLPYGGASSDQARNLDPDDQ